MLYTIYDTDAGEAVAHGRPWPTTEEGTGEIPGLAENIVFLAETTVSTPALNPLTHTVRLNDWTYDLDAKTAVRPKTLDERPLDVVKVAKGAEIDVTTRVKIGEGFTYDGHQFSLSDQAQMNIVGVKAAIDMGQITFPHKVSTSDADIEHALADEAAYNTFYLTALGTVKTHTDSGRALKMLVAACETVAEVVAVEDER
jgi:hypothetical protein